MRNNFDLSKGIYKALLWCCLINPIGYLASVITALYLLNGSENEFICALFEISIQGPYFIVQTFMLQISILRCITRCSQKIAEELKKNGDLIQSLYKYSDIVARSNFMPKIAKCCLNDQNDNLVKIGMNWKNYLLSERQTNFMQRFYQWFIRGGAVQLYNLEIPNVCVATNHFLEGKFILSLKETLKRKEKKVENFKRALEEIKKKKDSMANETLISLITQLAFRQRIISSIPTDGN